MGEEQDNSGLDTSGLVWILDPVDGTTNFIHRLGHSAISLALVAEGRGVLAIIFNPDTNELYTAIAGRGREAQRSGDTRQPHGKARRGPHRRRYEPRLP